MNDYSLEIFGNVTTDIGDLDSNIENIKLYQKYLEKQIKHLKMEIKRNYSIIKRIEITKEKLKQIHAEDYEKLNSMD